MRAMLDLNVVLDVVQERTPHYAASATVLSQAAEGAFQGLLPAHAVPTLYYIVARFAGGEKAGELVDWLLRDFEVVPSGKPELVLARSLAFDDFEDALVVACAVHAGCDVVVTRNIEDFRRSPVPALTPEEFLSRPD